MTKKKINTITYTTNWNLNTDVPTIKLVGNWLKDIGFNIGDKYEVITCNNVIMLVKQK